MRRISRRVSSRGRGRPCLNSMGSFRRIDLWLAFLARIQTPVSADMRKWHISAFRVVKWMSAIESRHTPRHFELSRRPVVSRPVGMVEAPQERRHQSPITLRATGCRSVNADDLAFLPQDSFDSNGKWCRVIEKLPAVCARAVNDLNQIARCDGDDRVQSSDGWHGSLSSAW